MHADDFRRSTWDPGELGGCLAAERPHALEDVRGCYPPT